MALASSGGVCGDMIERTGLSASERDNRVGVDLVFGILGMTDMSAECVIRKINQSKVLWEALN